MELDIREIIGVPGSRKAFDYDLDLKDLNFDSFAGYRGPAKISGEISNSAGVLEVRADLAVDVRCICSLCAKEFEQSIALPVFATLAAELQDEENPDIYVLKGEMVDLDEIMVTEFILNVSDKYLCKPDCKGLCPDCGADLNNGPCACVKEADPRLKILASLLEED